MAVEGVPNNGGAISTSEDSEEDESPGISANINGRVSGKNVPDPKTSSSNAVSAVSMAVDDSFVNDVNLCNPALYTNAQRYEEEAEARDDIEGSAGNDDNEEPRSPHSDGSSSQGSLSSTEFLDRNVLKMEKTIEEERLLDVVLPVDEQKLLEMFCKDQGFINRLNTFIVRDFESFGLSHHLNNSTAFKGLLYRFNNEDAEVSHARLGKLFVGQFRSNKSKIRQCSVPMSDTVNSLVEVDVTPFVLDADNEPASTTPEGGRADRMVAEPDQVPNYSGFYTKNKRMELSFPLSIDGLRNAYDWFHRESEMKRQLEKAGQVLFDDAFSDEEILNCTRGGKKGKRCFDLDKQRSIKGALKWLLIQKGNSVPSPKLTVAALEDDMKSQDFRLAKDDEDNFNSKVLTEYAYRRRKGLKAESAS